MTPCPICQRPLRKAPAPYDAQLLACVTCDATFDDAQLEQHRRAHALIQGAREAGLPALYSTGQGDAAIVQMKFFQPWGSWTWFVLEFDGDQECFGLVDGFECELGSFSLVELESIRGPGGLRIERDLHFSPTPLEKVRERVRALRGS